MKPEALRFNESIFISRACGFRSKGLNYKGNDFYVVVERDDDCDPLTREDVYAVTGLKSEMIPFSESQISNYLGFDLYPSGEIRFIKNSSDDGGTNPNTP
jgi:hypothetical protein